MSKICIYFRHRIIYTWKFRNSLLLAKFKRCLKFWLCVIKTFKVIGL